MAKETKIELETEHGSQLFTVEEADTLLRMKHNGGWRLPSDSMWSWSAERGFERKKTEKTDK